MVSVASIQLKLTDNRDKEETIQYALEMMDKAKNADLLLLPEIWNIGFFSFDDYEKLSEPIDGPTISAISSKAKEINSFVFSGSFVENKGGQLFNTSVMIDPNGKILAEYRKIHLYGYGSKEAKILSPGREVVVVETDLGRFGLSTCYDLRFPEQYRSMMFKGAETFLVTSGWPFPRVESWIVLNQARAIENVCYLVSCNCSGVSKGNPFIGHSMFVDPWGVVVAGSQHEERIIKHEIDLEYVKQVRNEFPPLRDIVPIE